MRSLPYLLVTLRGREADPVAPPADVEPQNVPDHEIYRLLDLAATEEDQHEVRLFVSSCTFFAHSRLPRALAH